MFGAVAAADDRGAGDDGRIAAPLRFGIELPNLRRPN
jgi:hypothetical protein